MGLLSTAKQWGTSIREWGGWILGHPYAAEAARSSYRVVESTLEQIPAAFAVVGSIVTDPATRKVANHASYIILTDLMALVTLTSGVALLVNNVTEDDPETHKGYTTTALLMSFYLLNHLIAIQRKLKDQEAKQVAKDTSKAVLKDAMIMLALIQGTRLSHYLEKDSVAKKTDDDHWFYTLQFFVLYLPTKALNLSLSILPGILVARNWIELQSHIFLVNLEAPALSDVSKISNVCEAAGCTPMDKTTGMFYDLATYCATEWALAKMGQLPIPLISSLTTIARTHHNGRYIGTVALSRLCNEHQIMFLLEHPEWAFSLGLSHLLIVQLVNWLLETTTGIPAEYYASAIDKLMLVAQMSVASHMRLAQPPLIRTRAPDPIEAFQTVVAFNSQTHILGLDKQTTLLPEGQTATSRRALHLLKHLPKFSGNKMGLMGEKIVVSLNPFLFIFLPDYLTSLEQLIHDPIARDNWPALQKGMISILKVIETARDSWLVTIASSTPTGSSYAAKGIFGMPPAITKLLLKLVNDDSVIEKMHRLRTQIEDLQVEKAKPIKADLKAIQRQGVALFQSYPTPLQQVQPASDRVIRASRRNIATKSTAQDSDNSDEIIRVSVNKHRFHNQPANPDTSTLDAAMQEELKMALSEAKPTSFTS